jgi:hypothetical protein
MATAKTSSFWLTETVILPFGSVAGTRVQSTLDLGSYINVAQGYAIGVEQADFIFQNGSDWGGDVASMLTGPGAITVQLSSLNPGTLLIRADDNSLIASTALNIDTVNSIATVASDFMPDNFGPANASSAYMVVNSTLYLVAGNDQNPVDVSNVYITVRLKCRIIKMGLKDFTALAIQSSASDS